MTFPAWLEFWPVDMPPGPAFLGVFAILGGAGLIVARLLGYGARVVCDRLASGSQEGSTLRVPDTHDPAREAAVLVEGTMPSAGSWAQVAYLRGGCKAVAEWLMATVIAEGWLRSAGGDDVFFVPPDGTAMTAPLARFCDDLGRDAQTTMTPVQVRTRANEVARSEEVRLRRQLEAGGLWRSAGLQRGVWLAYLAVPLVVLGIGGLRAIRGIALERPVGFLVVEWLVLAALFVVFGRSAAARRTVRADAFLRWLDAATQSMRSEISSGRRRASQDISLAAALTGMSVLVGVAAFAEFTPFLQGPLGSSSASDSGSDSSSCSSSSCGGGGCGGGCGG